MPFFTVGIPVYNAQKYLNACVESILSQDFSDFNLVLVDDGSTDASAVLCDAFAQKDNRVYVIHKPNGGISSASNVILEHLTGEYTFLMDNDDTMNPGVLKSIYEFIQSGHAADVIQCGYNIIAPDKATAVSVKEFMPECYDGTPSEKYSFVSPFPPALWSKVIRTQLFQEKGIRFEERYSGAQDLDISLKLVLADIKFDFLDIYTVNFYHPHEESVSSHYSEKSAQNLINIYTDYLTNDQINKGRFDYFSNWMFLTLIVYMCSFYYFPQNLYRKFIKQTKPAADLCLRQLKRPSSNNRFDQILAYVVQLCACVIGWEPTLWLVRFLLRIVKPISA